MKVLYSGGFDPFTNGHLEILTKALEMFNELVVVVEEKEDEWLPLEVRSLVVQQVLKGTGASICTGKEWEAGEIAKSVKADCLLRGLFQDPGCFQEISRAIGYESRSGIRTVFVAETGAHKMAPAAIKQHTDGPDWLDMFRREVPGWSLNQISARWVLHHIPEPWQEVFTRLQMVYGYQEYHNWVHIAHVLGVYEGWHRENLGALNPLEFNLGKLALLVHDDPSGAQYMREILTPYGGESKTLDRGIRLLHSMDHPFPRVEIPDPFGKLLHDIDLSILASKPSVYSWYSDQVRLEYLPKCSPEEYHNGRRAFLKNILTLKPIFLHPYFTRLETIARRNVSKELQLLSRDPGTCE